MILATLTRLQVKKSQLYIILTLVENWGRAKICNDRAVIAKAFIKKKYLPCDKHTLRTVSY